MHGSLTVKAVTKAANCKGYKMKSNEEIYNARLEEVFKELYEPISRRRRPASGLGRGPDYPEGNKRTYCATSRPSTEKALDAYVANLNKDSTKPKISKSLVREQQTRKFLKAEGWL